MVIQTYIWASYFGRAFLGTIRGITLPAILMASAIGAPAVGYIYDFTGGYALAWWLLIGIYGVAFLVMMSAVPPDRDGFGRSSDARLVGLFFRSRRSARSDSTSPLGDASPTA